MPRTAIALALSVALPCLSGAGIEADARRGAEFFQSQLCTNCHSIRGTGGHSAPDLARRLDRSYTPAGIASQMWNHAPVMWRSMSAENIPLPAVETHQAADLFAFFYSVRFFEKPGEAERGKELFQTKGCGGCHALTSDKPGVGTPVDKWAALTDPVVMVYRMWNHAADMQKAAASRYIPLPALTSLQLNDMLVYLQNLPQTRNAQLEFTLPSPEGGAELVQKEGCTDCHQGERAFDKRLKDSTLTEVAAGMWNHAPEMLEPHPALSLGEMRQIIGYVWAQQFFNPRGDVVRGKKTFESKKCAVCHNDSSSGAPALTIPVEQYSAITMVSVLWKHGPHMLRQMQQKNIAWPQLSQTEMLNLIAYLNSRGGVQPGK